MAGGAVAGLSQHLIQEQPGDIVRLLHDRLVLARERHAAQLGRDRAGVDNRHHLNVDRLIWANDFPHQESDWPDSDKVLAHNFAGVPRDEVHKMTVGNAVDFFRLP